MLELVFVKGCLYCSGNIRVNYRYVELKQFEIRLFENDGFR